ncbi:MAG: recombinase family protein, partial [Chloroflexi bacterium]|nr:recombinase family protein [Chloroflexota bacterium]
MDRYPAAYIRRSYVDAESPGDISKDAQLAAVHRLAQQDGHNGDVREYSDWGLSADVAKSAKRTEYARLLADMEAGSISAVYAYDVDRLYRDPRDLIRLQDAAQRHQVRIVTTGGALAIGDGDDPAAEAFAFIGSIFGRMELQKAKKRARAGREARRARGDRFGHAPYGFRHVKDESKRIVRVPDPD